MSIFQKTMSDQRKRRLRSALTCLLAILPAIFIWLSILWYGVDGPLWDEWLIGGYLDKFARGTLSAQDLFQQQNEYRQFFPNLIFVALGWLTRWDVRSWMLVSFFIAGLTSFSIYHLGKHSLYNHPLTAAWTFLVANLIIFSPVQYENWLQGQQLVYFLPIACFTASLLVASDSRLRVGVRFAVCALAALIASFSSANGMLTWVLILPVLAWSSSRVELWRRTSWILAWLAGFGLTLALYFANYRTPPATTSFSTFDPITASIYFLGILGRPLTPGRLIVAAPMGLVLLSVYGWFGVRFWKFRRSGAQAKLMLCWLILGAYSILTAALIVIGRSGQYAGPTLAATRYTTYSIYLPVALVYLVSLTLGSAAKQVQLFNLRLSSARVLTSLAAVLVLIHLPIYLLGIRQMSSFRVGALHSKACALFINVVQDECLAENVYPDIATLKQQINPANQLGLLRPGLVQSNQVSDIGNTQTQGPSNPGIFEHLVQIEGDRYFASGRSNVLERGEPADAVLLAYETDAGSAIIFAIAKVNTERDTVSALFKHAVYGDSRWSKYFLVNEKIPDRAKLTAWGFDATTGKAYKLSGEHVLLKSAAPE